MDATAVSVSASRTVLDVVQYFYAPVLLITFLIAFTARSILISRQATAQAMEEANKVILGPGGKPLPRKKKITKKSKARKGGKDKDEKEETEEVIDFSKPRKRLFECLSAIVCITFIASAANLIGHALIKREEGWWCGHPPVV
jgi:DNA-directed RNA polymerase specialized sigma54-like protein